MGAGVAVQVDEELVGAQEVGEVGGGGVAAAALPGQARPWRRITALGGDELEAGLVGDVAVGVGAAVGFLRPKPGHHAEFE